MKFIKKILKWLDNPKWYFLLPVVLIAVGATAGGTLILTQAEFYDTVLGFVLLGIAVITLSYSVFGIIRIYPKIKDNLLKQAKKHPNIDKKFNEYGFTTLIFTAGSMLVTFAFAVYNGSIAVVIRSIWFGALAGYYVVLVLLRGSVLLYYGARKKAVDKGQNETKTLINDAKFYRVCGIMLFLLPVCLSFAILQMVRVGDSFEHKGITIYVYAIYAFFKIITAIYSFIKERSNRAMVITSTKNIKLADAFVSVLALQTAMFREFGDLAGNSTAIMNAVTGAVVCALTVAVGIYMIIKANSVIKKIKTKENE